MTAPVRSSISEAVYATVSYADVFDVAIDLQTLHRYLVGTSRSLLETSMAVDNLVSTQRLGRRGELVHLADRGEVLDVYDDRTARAASRWKDAEYWGQRIGRLPLVRMVAVTGGLASDEITLFIVVRPRRLWMTRWMILRLCREAAQSGIRLRPSVITTTRSVELDDGSIHVAQELAQMAVIVGDTACQAVRRGNPWIFDLLPNATVAGERRHLSSVVPSTKQKWTEWLLLLPPFRIIEHQVRRQAIAKLRRAHSHELDDMASLNTAFSAEVCKGDLVAAAARIERAWRHRIDPS